MRKLETLYHTTQHRIADLVAAAGEDAARTPVPACPGWTVHDVISHVTGICADILAGNVAGAATDEWTAAQVDARRDRTTAEVLAEWNEKGTQLAAMADDFPGQYGHQLATDVAIHEQDIRGALGVSGARDSDAVFHGLEFLVSTLIDPGATALGLGPIEFRSNGKAWVAGTGDSSAIGDARIAFDAALQASDGPDLSSPRPPAKASVEAPAFELFRAMTGRRSRSQITGYGWSDDPSEYIALFNLWPFSMRDDDLAE